MERDKMDITFIEDRNTFRVSFAQDRFDADSSENISKVAEKWFNRKNMPIVRFYHKDKPNCDDADSVYANVNAELQGKGLVIRARLNGRYVNYAVIREDAEGILHFEFTETGKILFEDPTFTKIFQRRPGKKNAEQPLLPQQEPAAEPAPEQKQAPEKTEAPIICDPTSDAAKALVGKTVEISKGYRFPTGEFVKLMELDLESTTPFKGKNQADQWVFGSSVREARDYLRPLDLSVPAVRKNLRGTWITEKASGSEIQICSFLHGTDGIWRINGVIDANHLMNEWVSDDGSVLASIVKASWVEEMT